MELVKEREITLKAIGGNRAGDGEPFVRAIHGRAPNGIIDLAGWVKFALENLKITEELLDIEIDSVNEAHTLITATQATLAYPMGLLCDMAEELTKAFPDDPEIQNVAKDLEEPGEEGDE